MDWLDALWLGIVQGLAEYLPISSSGHLEICRQLLGVPLAGADALEFDVTLHVATVLSTIVVLWREFVPLCRSFFTLKRDANTVYVWKILLSCIPVGIVGFCFKDQIEEVFGKGLDVVGVCLLVTAALLAFAYFYRRDEDSKTGGGTSAGKGHEITWFDSFVIGCAQAVAVLPGLSRSGSTIATGLLLGDRRDKIAQFSFFMVIVPILGEALLDIKDLLWPSAEKAAQAAASGVAVGPLALGVGFMASFIVGCVACKWMINLVKKGKMVWFAVYCTAMGAICLLW